MSEAAGESGTDASRRDLDLLVWDGVASQVMGALTGGALLVAYALQLGASRTTIGVIAALGPATQLLQLPAIILVERYRSRKRLVLGALSVGRSFWLLVAAVPFVPPALQMPLLILALSVYYAAGSLASSAYNSWKRDIVPDAVIGRFLGERLALATAAAAAVTLACGFAIDHSGPWLAGTRIYALLFVLGAAVGLGGVSFLAAIREPRMEHHTGGTLRSILLEPVRDGNFRALLIFLASWNFAVNLAAPFFTVYLLERIGLGMAWVLGFSVLSQVANLGFLRIWGRLADRVSHKTVLGLSGTLFVLSIALWPFTTMPAPHALTLPLLAFIHVLAGISTAGVTLSAAGITLKLAPRGKGTAFLAVNAMASGVAATVAPLIAGFAGDALVGESLRLDLRWASADQPRAMFTALDLAGLDFVFVGAVLLGLYALHRLLAVQEIGEITEGAASELYLEVRKAVRQVSTVAGLRRLTYFPYSLLRSGKVAVDALRSDPRGEGPPPRDR